MDSLDIKDYVPYLKEHVCASCKRANKCKDHDKLCVGKKLIFNLGKRLYKKREGIK